MANLFRNGSVYSTYRPTYPEELYERILAFSSLPEGQRRLAVDIATGSGQVRGHGKQCAGAHVGVGCQGTNLLPIRPVNPVLGPIPASFCKSWTTSGSF